jgi:hypothetical protein
MLSLNLSLLIDYAKKFQYNDYLFFKYYLNYIILNIKKFN